MNALKSEMVQARRDAAPIHLKHFEVLCQIQQLGMSKNDNFAGSKRYCTGENPWGPWFVWQGLRKFLFESLGYLF